MNKVLLVSGVEQSDSVIHILQIFLQYMLFILILFNVASCS